MGKAALPLKVKLIIGYIFGGRSGLERAEGLCRKRFGRIDHESAVYDFSFSDYYRDEMGERLKRKFVSFERLMRPEDIYEAKLLTNEIEKRLSEGGRRAVNIDPGYLTEAKVVLLTTKDHAHRIYLRNGIYAESTLRFTAGSYSPWEWTYPDYRTEAYRSVFHEIRLRYRNQIGRKRS